jgi:hypothetical protein
LAATSAKPRSGARSEFLVSGLSIARTGARISYATSISISDARAILTTAAQMLGGYFGQVP